MVGRIFAILFLVMLSGGWDGIHPGCCGVSGADVHFVEYRSTNGCISVSSIGAQVTSWRPAALAGEEVFFMASETPWGSEVHGGIPICWPWLGRREGLPIHGLVRYMKWRRVEIAESKGLSFETEATPESRTIWPHGFRLRVTMSLPAPNRLEVELTESNTDNVPFESGFGFHPYILVADSCDVELDGDRVSRPNGETFKFAADGKAHGLTDVRRKRRYKVSADGIDMWYLWNAGVECTPMLKTLAPDDWKHFFCLEPLRFKPLSLAPGESRVFRFAIQIVEP